MDCNHEETSNLLFSEERKLSVNEKHMPIKKRAWVLEMNFSSNVNDEITIKEECDLSFSEDVGILCPRCKYVIPPKKLRGSESYNVTDDQSEALSKGHGLETTEPAGLERYIEYSKIESKQEGSDLVKESLIEETSIEKNGEVGAVELNARVSEIDSGKNEPDNESREVTAPDIYELDKDMDKGCIGSDEVWAVYDGKDGMPRSYAWIRKVFFPGFKMRVTWLEAIPDDPDEINNVGEDLPVCCGHFKHGKTEITENIDMFSHSVVYSKDTSRSSFVIYPRKGETWALFKDCDIKWSSDLGTLNKVELDLVEILSDYTEESGISVACLEKVKGAIFRPNGGVASIQIPPNELYRLSHMVPSHRMSGKECEDVPEGSFELDPASLPANLVEDMKNRWTPLQQWRSTAVHSQKQPGARQRFRNFTRRQCSVVNSYQEQNQLKQQTFWTACPSCCMRYQYYTDIMNKSVQCPKCVKPFIAFDLGYENTVNLTEVIDEQSTRHRQWQNSSYLGNKRTGVGKGCGIISGIQFRRDCYRREQNYIERSTFWTACPFCHLKYKYYKDTLRRTVRCQNCRKDFIATL